MRNKASNFAKKQRTDDSVQWKTALVGVSRMAQNKIS